MSEHTSWTLYVCPSCGGYTSDADRIDCECGQITHWDEVLVVPLSSIADAGARAWKHAAEVVGRNNQLLKPCTTVGYLVHGDPMCSDCHREKDGGDPLTIDDARELRARCSVCDGDLEDFL